MKFQERMFNMSKAEEAFRVKVNGAIYTVVPFGPYAGTWTYRQNKMYYIAEILQHTTTIIGDKTVNLPLPGWCYNKADEYFKEQIGNFQQALQRKLWSNFRFRHLDALERETIQYMNEMNLPGSLVSSYMKSTVAMCLALTPDVFRKAMYAHPERVKHVVEWLNKNNILATIGVAKRKLFVERCLKFGIKTALRKGFTKVTPQTINSLMNFKFTVDCKLLSSVILPASYAVINYLNSVKEGFTDSTYQTAQKVGVKYGLSALGYYCQFVREHYRASRINIDVQKYSLSTVTSEASYVKWHDEIADAIAEHVRVSSLMDRPHIEALHMNNWFGLNCPDTITPLITYEEFVEEGKSMHHCVGGYADTTRCLFAHIEYKGEKATVQFDSEEIIQLYGVCNAQVSPELRKHFESFYYQRAHIELLG